MRRALLYVAVAGLVIAVAFFATMAAAALWQDWRSWR